MDHNLYHGQVENRYNQPITTKQVLKKRCGAVGSASDSWLVDTCRWWALSKAPVGSL